MKKQYQPIRFTNSVIDGLPNQRSLAIYKYTQLSHLGVLVGAVKIAVQYSGFFGNMAFKPHILGMNPWCNIRAELFLRFRSFY
jgi:hypothetical protein